MPQSEAPDAFIADTAPTRIALVAFDDFQLLDLAGPADVFRTATLLGAEPGYELVLATETGRSARSVSGISVEADCSTTQLANAVLGPTAELGARPGERVGDIHTLMAIGGLGVREAAAHTQLLDEVRALSAASERTTSVCSGALLLAAAGLLDGYDATTHWASCAELADGHPAVRVQSDRIYVQDRDRWTSAGVTAGIDLALALVEADHGPDLAHAVAAWLVVFVRRPGGQSQFSAQLQIPPARRDELRALQRWVPDHLGEDLSISALATRASMSERTFVRAWRAETGSTPAAYVEGLRIEAARRLLESTDLTVAAIAQQVGLGRPERLHRAIRRRLGTTPDSYRQHFARH